MMYTRSTFSNTSMLTIFSMEVEKQIVVLNDNLLAAENQTDGDNADSTAPLEALMRSAHSIKGAARIVGLDLAVDVAHIMEECFVAAQKSKLVLGSACVDELLKGVDWFTQLGSIKDDTQPEWLEEHKESTQQLVVAIASLLTQSVTSPSPIELPSTSDDDSGSIESPDAKRNDIQSPDITSSQDKAPLQAASWHQAPSDTEANHTLQEDSHHDRTVKVNADNLNQLMALAGESLVEVNWLQPFADTMQHLKKRQQSLNTLLDQLQQEVTLPAAAKNKLEKAKETALDCHALLSDRIGDLDQFSRRFSQLSDNLYRQVIASHMRPFSDGTQGFARMVRDIARAEGKQVSLKIVGQHIQIDRDILQKLESPLTHILRNAVVHGIESPNRRQQLGKSEAGTIRLEASHRAGMLSILVSDDGSGLDLEALRNSVIEKQLAPPDLAAQLSDAELMEFLFLPGFSTAEQVSEIAGRGVGLDIAKSMVQEVGGLLHPYNEPGCGLTFHFQLPLTLSVIRALVVEISGEPYAFGLTRIDQVRLVKRADVAMSENRPYVVVDEENISLVNAYQVLELPEPNHEVGDHLPVIILKDQGQRYGIVVDSFWGERELVVRPLDERFGKVQDVSAAAITEEGLPLLIVDVADLIRSIEQLVLEGNLTLLGDRTAQNSQKQKRVLVVDDSLTVREMERQLLQNHGYQVDVAVNGMEGWNTVRTGDYDLVVSDVDMPRMNGIELLSHIKNHPNLKQLPVIIVSYKDRQADKMAGLNAGADYYLTKGSFQDNSLLTAVMDLIGQC
ncbi:MAG: hybrid sensor histidine kinase/response regulator [Cyanobacteria bacterium J06627_28]